MNNINTAIAVPLAQDVLKSQLKNTSSSQEIQKVAS